MYREIREQALSRRELATRFGLSSLKNMNLGSKLRDFALMAAVTTGATEAGSAIFHAISKPSGDAVSTGGEAAAGAAKAGGGSATPHISDANTVLPNGEPPTTPPVTTGSDLTTTPSTYSEPPTTGQSNLVGTVSTNPTTRSVSDQEERAFDHSLPVNLFGEPYLRHVFRQRCS